MDINKDHGEIFKREKVYIYIKLYTHFIVQIFRNFSCFYCKFLIEQSCSWSRVGVGASGPRPRLWGGRPGLPTRRFPLSSRQPSGAPRPRLGGPGAREGRPEPSPSAFPFSSLRFHCHRFNIWIFFFFYLREKARTSVPGVCSPASGASDAGPSWGRGLLLPRLRRSAAPVPYLFLCCFYHGINY